MTEETVRDNEAYLDYLRKHRARGSREAEGLREAARRLFLSANVQDVVDAMEEGVYMVDTARQLLYWNRAAEAITGYAFEDIAGSHCYDNILQHVDDEGRELCLEEATCPLHMSMVDGARREARVFLRHKDGRRVPVLVKTLPIRDRDERILGAMEVFCEDAMVETVRRREAEMAGTTQLDATTGLPDARFVAAALRQRLDELNRHAWPFACFLAEIDGFDALVDQYGEVAGNITLRTVGNTLAMACRASDVIGRWDEHRIFGVLRNVATPGALQKAVDQFCGLARRALVKSSALETGITLSVGATLAARGDTEETLAARLAAALAESRAVGDRAVVKAAPVTLTVDGA